MARTKLAVVREIVELFCSRKNIEKIFRDNAVVMEECGNIAASNIFRKMVESLIVDEIISDAEVILLKKFTLGELKAIRDFHASPVGRRYIKASPQIHKEITALAQSRITNELEREYKNGGFE